MSYSVEAGRDYTFEPTVEECFRDLRMDNARVNAAYVLLGRLLAMMGQEAASQEGGSFENLIGVVTEFKKIKEIERMEETIKSFGKLRGKNLG